MFVIKFVPIYNQKGENKPYASAQTRNECLKFSTNFIIIIIEKINKTRENQIFEIFSIELLYFIDTIIISKETLVF